MRSISASVCLGELARVGDQHGRRVVAVLGLAEQVGGAHLGVDGLVGDHHGLGRAGEEVDADAAVELALGLGDEGVAGADQHVDRRDRLGAERHRADRLHAAEHVDLVRARQVHGGDDGRDAARPGAAAPSDDARHAGDRGGQHRHVRRGDHREFAGRHIAADRLHRDVLVAEDHAGQRLDLDIGHRGALGLGEAPHLRLGEVDVGHVARRHFVHRCIDFRLGQAEGRRRVLVEFL